MKISVLPRASTIILNDDDDVDDHDDDSITLHNQLKGLRHPVVISGRSVLPLLNTSHFTSRSSRENNLLLGPGDSV